MVHHPPDLQHENVEVDETNTINSDNDINETNYFTENKICNGPNLR